MRVTGGIHAHLGLTVLPLAALPLAGLFLAGPALALDLQGTIQGRRTVKAADSPLRISADLTVPKGASLWLEPGVTVQLGEGACLVIEGQLHALGERRAPIRFEPLAEGARWGNIKILGDKDLPCYDGDRHYVDDSGGSRLLFCEFRQGGKVPDQRYDGGAVYLNGSAPLIRDCTFQGNQADRGGALVCYNFATPLIEGCTFEGNSSTIDDGGAIHCFFYSDAQILRNFFVQNRSARHGGGLYISVSNPLVQENAFIDNTAAAWGGAVYVSSSSPRILDNALYEATAEDRSTGLVFQADCRPEVKGNSLQSGGIEVFGLNLAGDLELSGNWWGTTEEYLIQGKVQQRGRGQDRRLNTAPWRDRPVANLLTQPVEILSLKAMADGQWADTLAFDLCDQALARLQITAVDRNRFAVDQTMVEVKVLERPSVGATLIFVETDKASGIFRSRLAINRDVDDVVDLRVSVGEHLLFSSMINPDLKRLYRVDEARPVVFDLSVVSEVDPTHAVAATEQVGWKYFSLLDEPLSAWHLQVSTDSSFARIDMWDSGASPAPAATRVLTYAGRPLQDGERYFLRLRCQGGQSWSAWKRFVVRTDNAEATLRLNSLPPVPPQLEPAAEALVATTRPQLKVGAVRDREGDTVGYEFQLAQDEFFQQVVTGSDGHAWREAAWSVDRDLQENRAYWWRVRVLDGFEEGSWSAPRRLHINAVEEAPLPFELTGPAGGVADLQPEFGWSAAADPDPLSSVSYTLVVAPNEALGQAQRVAGLDVLACRLKSELVNRQPVWWTVEAKDNSGRVTRGRQVLRLVPDTTPSAPVPLFPAGGEEALAGQRLRFTPAQDPWAADRLLYDLQVVAEGSSFDKPLLQAKGLSAEELAGSSLEAFPESRLLVEDHAHLWRLRAVDNHGAASAWSEPASFWLNRSNSAPSRPEAGLLPADGALLRTAPVLTWNASSDPDHTDPPASLGYVVQVSQDPDFTRVIEERLAGQTRLELAERVADNARWYWRVQALDNSQAASAWSPVHSFVYNRAEDPPAGLAWLEPAEGATLHRLDQIDLSWQAARDPDWNARLTYSWRVSPVGEPARVLAQGSTAETRAVAKAAFASRADYQIILSVKDETGLEQALPPRRVRVDSHPSAPLPTVDKPDLGPTDLLSWQASADPDPNDRLSYRLTLRTAGGKTIVNAPLTATQATLGRLPGNEGLPEDQEITWIVTAVDPHGLEAASSEGRFWYSRVNAAPSAPGFAPELASAGVLRSERPRVAFTPGKDPDHGDPPSTLWHEIQVAGSATFQNPITQRVEAGRSEVEALPLGDNARWHLRVRCLDNEGAAGPWSPPIQLVVNLKEDPPSAPVWREPAPAQALYDLSGISLAWSAATDPDQDAKLGYRVILQDATGKELTRRTTEQTSLRLAQPLQNGVEYRLQLTALDETGLEASAPPLRATVESRPGPVVISGRGEQALGAGDAVAWSAASDPDPNDRLVYELAWSVNRGFADARTMSVSGLRQPLAGLTGLPENGEVWLRVRAVDPHQLEGPWSEAWSLVYDAVNEAPRFKGRLAPAGGSLAEESPSFSWSAPEDPDRRPQKLSVELQMAGDAGFKEIVWQKKVEAASTSIAVPMKENSRRWVRARALDQGGAASDWSPVEAYVIDARPEAPSAPLPTVPANNSRQAPGRIEFRWRAGQDPDPGAAPRHWLVLSGPAGERRLEVEAAGQGVELEAGEWTWRVEAADAGGLSATSPGWKLSVQAPPPAPSTPATRTPQSQPRP